MLQSIQSHFTVKRCGLQKGDLGHLRALFGLDLSHLAPVSKRGDSYCDRLQVQRGAPGLTLRFGLFL